MNYKIIDKVQTKQLKHGDCFVWIDEELYCLWVWDHYRPYARVIHISDNFISDWHLADSSLWESFKNTYVDLTNLKMKLVGE